jgi:predicted short-subunit dehydrogenase-like oxidoreductase (DUF2520 family)
MAFAIGIAGTGRMARALGKVLFSRGVPIAAVGGRNAKNAEEAADFIGCGISARMHNLPSYASCILISVSDDAIPAVADQLVFGGMTGGLALHTCGAHGPDVLAPLRAQGNEVGVFHPLVGVPQAERGVIAMPGATFACAGDPGALAWALEMVEIMQGRNLAVDPAHWHLYHAAAAIAGNYQCTLADAALELLEQAGVPRETALPAFASFLRATTESILTIGPAKALPGPISRGDAGTIRRHITALKASGSPETNRLYAAAGLRTIEVAQRKGTLSDTAAAEIRAILKQFSHENA